MELANRIREIATERYVHPARAAGRREFSIAVKDLMADAKACGISTVQRTPLFCNSIQTKDFRLDNGLEIFKVDGPAKKLSTTVVVYYRLSGIVGQRDREQTGETAEARARRLTERLRGLMKEEIAEHGGVAGYLRWARGNEEEDAA